MPGKLNLTLVSQPQDYFRELVTGAMDKQKVSTRPETEFYLVNLLNQFMTTDKLYARGPEGQAKEEPLAIMIKEALEEPGANARNALFRHIGDFSLYTAGFFQASLNRKLVDVDYYIDMGGTAYQYISSRMSSGNPDATLKAVYQELAEKFGLLVDVLAEVSDKTCQRTEKDLLRVYEVWMKTRSERAARVLHEAGILPNPTVKTDVQ